MKPSLGVLVLAILLALGVWFASTADAPSPAARTVAPAATPAPSPAATPAPSPAATPAPSPGATPAPVVQEPQPESTGPEQTLHPLETSVEGFHVGEDGPLRVISETSVAYVVAVSSESAKLVEAIKKPLTFRELNRGSGPYAYRLLGARGEALFVGAFELPELCPLASHAADTPHQEGHVLIEHETTLVLRVPALPAATHLELVRQIPLVDAAPHHLGTLTLRTP